MNMIEYNLLPREADKDNLKELINLIKANKCVAFVGAGMSLNQGYRLWRNLLFDEDTALNEPGLLAFAKIKVENQNNPDLPKIVDTCLDAISPPLYHDFMRNEYARKSTVVSENHLLICKINFNHIITTNFDPCLYDNAENLITKMVTYPGNSLEDIINRTLFNIHGRAYLQDKEDPKFLDNLIDALIFGGRSYSKHYSDGFEIKQFIYRIVKSYKIVFLGFSMDDIIFKNTLETIVRARNNFVDDIAHRFSLDSDIIDTGIGSIFLEYPIDAFEKLRIDEKIIAADERINLLNLLSRFNDTEKKLNELGLKVIGYNRVDSAHKGLTIILQQIKEQAPIPSLKAPVEELDAHIAASLIGGL